MLLIVMLLAVVAKPIMEGIQAEEARRQARREGLMHLAIDEVAKKRVEALTDVQACLDKGGVPVKTLVLGRLKRCDFPGKK